MPAAKAPGAAGRPKGTSAPKTATTPSPIGKSKASFSIKALSNLSNQVSALHSKVDGAVKSKFKIKETNSTQAAIVKEIVAGIISNEPLANWDKAVASYVKSPKDSTEEVKKEIENIQLEHDVDYYSAAILRLSTDELFD